jgi:hypothetical protein
VLAYSSSIVPEHFARPILKTDDPVLLGKIQAELASRQAWNDWFERLRD